MGYDEVIPLLGDFGRYQKRVYFLLCLPAIICAFHKLGNVFLIADPDYRCALPNEFPQNATYNLSDADWQKYFPWDDRNKKYSSCKVIVDNQTKYCDQFVYDKSVYGHTSVIEFELTCSQAYKIANGNALFMFGVMLGSIVFGELSDRYGRKLIFFISLVIQVVFGTLASVAPEYWSFTLARLLIGASTSGVFLVAYVLALEMVGPMKRPIAGTVCQIFFSGGYMLTAVFAIYIDDWRNLQLALTLPGLVFLCYWWFIPESVRWLITKDNIPEAKRLIQVAAKENNVTIDDETLDQLLKPSEPVDEKAEKQRTPNVLDLFRYPNLRKRSLIIFFDWFANNLTYYGLSWNTNNLGGNPYLNFVISGAVEIPAYTFLILTLNRWGRKNVMCGCMIVAGIALLLTVIIPSDAAWQPLVIALAMVGKLAITASYGAVYIFSTEQFPTVIRNAGLGAGSTCARIGSVLAPYINILNKFWQPMPLVIFGALAFIGGILSLLLPETLNRKLPETMEEGENFGRTRKSEKNEEKIENGDVEEPLKLVAKANGEL